MTFPEGKLRTGLPVAKGDPASKVQLAQLQAAFSHATVFHDSKMA